MRTSVIEQANGAMLRKFRSSADQTGRAPRIPPSTPTDGVDQSRTLSNNARACERIGKRPLFGLQQLLLVRVSSH